MPQAGPINLALHSGAQEITGSRGPACAELEPHTVLGLGELVQPAPWMACYCVGSKRLGTMIKQLPKLWLETLTQGKPHDHTLSAFRL